MMEKKSEKECREAQKENSILTPTQGEKREAETQRPTRFEAPVDIRRAAGSDGADDGAEIGAARVLSAHDLEPWRRKIKQMSTSAETLKCQLLIYVGGGD